MESKKTDYLEEAQLRFETAVNAAINARPIPLKDRTSGNHESNASVKARGKS